MLVGLPAFASAAAPLNVVTTVAPITDIVKQVGADAISLRGLVPAGINSHLFSPTPGDVRYLADADLVILNGLLLEVPTEKLARRSSKPNVVILKLGDRTIGQANWVFDKPFPTSQGHPNPHLWLDVTHAMTYVTLVRDQLSALDPAHEALYQTNAATYLQQLTRLDRCIETAIATIPPPHRKLLTYHDAWLYFARRYGMTVIGAIQPANFAEPSARDMTRMMTQIRQAKVPAIFGSEVFPSKVLKKIADETQVQYVDTLRDDDLPGEPGEARHSYVGMMLTNVAAMVPALGGDPQALDTCWAQRLTKNSDRR
jgi:ABC-type Zn uptake system ZnuABC Zn-binding protein ZnuA